MTEAEILKRAIEKAIKGGYIIEIDKQPICKITNYVSIIFWGGLPSLIFSHSFAKAFWGKEKLFYCPSHRMYYKNENDELHDFCKRTYYTVEWKHHLQQMVLEEQPLKYIEGFLEKKEKK